MNTTQADIFPIETLRHSCAHLMAAALLQLHPNAKFGVGPETKNGFYYDVLLPEALTESDLKDIEKRMIKLRKRKIPFERRDTTIEDALETMRASEQDFKVELLELIRDKGTTAISKETGDENIVGDDSDSNSETPVSFYTLGEFLDLCRGPHVNHSGEVGAFKLTHLAGAYWRGDNKRPQLQRIYGLCYRTKEEVAAERERLEEVKKRDHRTLGRQLDLFAFANEVGPGLPLWLPNGVVLRDELEMLARERERRRDYQRVSTPALAKASLYHQSGHLPYYKEDLYPAMELDDGMDYYIRPMNCPHHHHVFLARPRTYRELPLRLAEYGDVYRYEASGALTGLMRTRGFCQNDSHIYCSFDQAKDEFLDVMLMHKEYYEMFDIDKFYMRLSLPDMSRLDKYVDAPDEWLAAVEVIRQAMQESGLDFIEVEGEAAFYGPKVDFMISSAIGTEYAISTNQLDFLATQRFDLNYTASDGEKHPVYVIHRSPLGSHERFVAFLIEHYAGAFPLWLAPVQVVLIPVTDKHLEYCEQVKQELLAANVHNATHGLRVEVDSSPDRMQKKIRNAETRKIPYQIVMGDREVESHCAAIRHYALGDLGSFSIEDLIDRLKTEVEARRDLTS